MKLIQILEKMFNSHLAFNGGLFSVIKNYIVGLKINLFNLTNYFYLFNQFFKLNLVF